jgi:hypothetical protein
MLDSTPGITSSDGASKDPASSGRELPGGLWWSRQFKLSVLDCFTPLAKGLPYVRAGQVSELTIAPGSVFAKVQGSRGNPYMVELELPVFGAGQWAVLEAELAARLGPLAPGDEEGGTLPEDLAPLLAEASLPLFPDGGQELVFHCNCVEVPKPCRHIAAACLALAEALDREPLQLCRWRGREPEQLLEAVSGLRAALVFRGPAPAPEPPSPPARASGYPGAEAQRAFYLEVRERCRMDVEQMNLTILAEWGRLNEEVLRVQDLIQDLEGRKRVAGQMYAAAGGLLGETDGLDVSPAFPEG